MMKMIFFCGKSNIIARFLDSHLTEIKQGCILYIKGKSIYGGKMKKISSIFLLAIIMSSFTINPAQAGEIIYHYGDGTSGTTPPTQAQSAVGGFAVVNPETGVVHGVITGSVEYFSNNSQAMVSEYMGCSAGCQIIMQSTSDQNGNVAGIHGPNVTYKNDRNVFQVVETDVFQTETITEFASNTYAVETDIGVSRSARFYEFGVQDLKNTNGVFQINEVAPPQNTSAQVSATTKEYVCEESSTICSQRLSNASTTISEEVVSFSERKTSEQVLTQVVAEAKTKIREQISLILSMLGKWVIN